ncbi:hypothetical protein H6P81_011019 [Aristolochia fimbriata]|uniref:BHLH domain-containing protein n=1 Tax=Aristolochia fimbriata TaxID=158543 RepID=A0AAV7ER27_ARIFI|nr:hypothetical protein H6P81_011019 [Aristolochia fimbriata]
MMESRQASACKLERKTIEKNRRIHMKSLCLQLASLIPTSHSTKEAVSMQEQLMRATIYITQLRQRVEEKKKKKDQALLAMQRMNNNSIMVRPAAASVQIRGEYSSNNLEVVLISGLPNTFKLSEVYRILVEEGVEVTSASFAVFGDRIVHILHVQVTCTRVGFERATVYRRLKELVVW